MKIVITKDLPAGELHNLLQKPAFDAVVLSPGAARRLRQVFGTELTAAAAVDRIIAAVRAEGTLPCCVIPRPSTGCH